MVDRDGQYDVWVNFSSNKLLQRSSSGKTLASSSPASQSESYYGIDRSVLSDIEVARMKRNMRESATRQQAMLTEYFNRIRNGEDAMMVYCEMMPGLLRHSVVKPMSTEESLAQVYTTSKNPAVKKLALREIANLRKVRS